MLQGILIIVVFLVIAALMMTKKIPTLLALPLEEQPNAHGR